MCPPPPFDYSRERGGGQGFGEPGKRQVPVITEWEKPSSVQPGWAPRSLCPQVAPTLTEVWEEEE